VRYSCCVQEEGKRDTLYIQFATCSVPCHVIVNAVIWRVSKVNVLFTILLLLMQFRNTLNDAKRRKKKKKRGRNPPGDNIEETVQHMLQGE
jgi:hypothetical protein